MNTEALGITRSAGSSSPDLDAACDRFESSWREGVRPRIEDFLADTAEIDQPVLFRRLLATELTIRSELGERPSLDEYRKRFGDRRDSVEAIFGEMGAPMVPAEEAPSTVATGDAGPSVTKLLPHTDRDNGDESHAYPAKNDVPTQIGRYKLERLLGEGGFGRVFLAIDSELNRRVAIKVPHAHRILSARDVDTYLDEARTLARLDHPGIVPVYDVGRTQDDHCYIVSKYIEGSDLATRLQEGLPSPYEAAVLIAAVAEALHYAHTQRMVHRDVKPRNILIDRSGKPYLADFGLALKEENVGTGPTFAGTLVYMSPEQARGEGHLVDGRSDIFSLGVVMYEVLTGTRPFKGRDWFETVERIKTQEARPPRQFVDAIPRELERICLKALSKRVSDRYNTALDMAEDVRHALASLESPSDGRSGQRPPSQTPAGDSSLLFCPVVPKGLRSFDANDADFFLRLLPGPRDRDGLPQLLASWKTMIEELDPDRTFRAGLVYGPSGCGKSSFVKAGLIPRLAPHVTTIVIDATATGLEARLAANLRRSFPELGSELRLPQLLASVRRGQALPAGGKLLIVVDQFEQWLYGNRDLERSELVEALRQCDGERLQCLLVVRDDFWMSVTRFMSALDVVLVEGRNSAAVDLFDARHARKVLAAFGAAFEALPAAPDSLTPDQDSFLDQTIASLERDGKVSPVQLSLFAEMVKNKPWKLATLKHLGGAHGVGVSFLEETFGSVSAPPVHRLHQKGIRAVLKALLPEPGIDIKGHMRSRRELLEVSGDAQRPHAFVELMRVLEDELRLITPIDPEGGDPEDSQDTAGEPHYQLTHDYLVPALREWLGRKQRETRRGRAEIRLAERAALWSARPEQRQLPSPGEWLAIRLFTRSSNWSDREREMMKRASRHHLMRASTAVLILAIAAAGTLVSFGRLRAQMLIDRLFAAETAKVPAIVEQMAPYRRWIDPRLRAIRPRLHAGTPEALHASLALLPSDRGESRELVAQLLHASPPNVKVIRDALSPTAETVCESLWTILTNVQIERESRLRAACALAAFDPNSARWSAVAPDLVSILTAEDLFSIVHWSDLLRPVAPRLREPLRQSFLVHQGSPKGTVAASLLAEYAADQPDFLCTLIQEADPRQLNGLTSKMGDQREAVIRMIGQVLDRPIPLRATQPQLDQDAKQRANAAIALLTLGRGERLWPLLKNEADPRLRTYLIQRLSRTDVNPQLLIDRLEREPEGSIRQALVLSLAGFEDDLLPPGKRMSLLPTLLDRFKNDPDPGVHSALDWLLGRWKLSDRVRALDVELARLGDRSRIDWLVNSEGHTMAKIKGPVVFLMGSPADEHARQENETQHPCRIGRSFAIGTREVTVNQFLRFAPDHPYHREFSPDPECPVTRVTWFDAARYCRWLSEKEGIPEDQMCYPRIDEIKEGMRMPSNYLSRTGYRLPTEAEWEAACRAGTTTARFYGDDPALLELFAWPYYTSRLRTHPVGECLPNPLGLFDVLGNAYERCLDELKEYPSPSEGLPVDDVETVDIVGNNVGVLRGSAFHRSSGDLRSAQRWADANSDPNDRVGFRICRTIRGTAD